MECRYRAIWLLTRIPFSRAYRPVGSGKTALMLKLCLALRDEYSIAAVTNDIFTR